MNLNGLWLSAVLCVAATASSAATTAPRETVRRLRFERGRTSATVSGAAVRGTRDCYLVGARRGQKMTLRLSSLEFNAAFDISAPGHEGRLNTMDDTTIWEGRLPASGDYRACVGPVRGNATYTLEVTIEN